MPLIAVPASLALNPILASVPKNALASSRGTFNLSNVPPAITKASINASISVFDLRDVCATWSRYPSRSSTPNPNPAIESVTKSADRPRSSAPASARCSTGSSPSIICVVSHPARARYCNPSDASFAENDVADPSSLALSVSACNSSPVAPLTADTCDIPLSKSAAVLTALPRRSEEHTSELQSRGQLVCRLLLENNNHMYLVFGRIHNN